MSCITTVSGYGITILTLRDVLSQYALHVYNEVMSVGQKYGIRNAGYYALRSLRIEKFFAFWGQDLDSFTTPIECGREFRVKFDKVCTTGLCFMDLVSQFGLNISALSASSQSDVCKYIYIL